MARNSRPDQEQPENDKGNVTDVEKKNYVRKSCIEKHFSGLLEELNENPLVRSHSQFRYSHNPSTSTGWTFPL
ncbi:MAG: hypothetical protein JWM11_2007 [Planctomycetaceae bacterium]|nr:hypothetical protein [Planctomycetaceae bacterium]